MTTIICILLLMLFYGCGGQLELKLMVDLLEKMEARFLDWARGGDWHFGFLWRGGTGEQHVYCRTEKEADEGGRSGSGGFHILQKTGVNQELSICCLSCSASNVGWFHGGTTLTCKALKAQSFCSSRLKERGAMNDIQLLSAEAIPLQEQLLVPLLPKAHPGDHTPLK